MQGLEVKDMAIEISDKELKNMLTVPLFQSLLDVKWDESAKEIKYTFNGQIKTFDSFEKLRQFINEKLESSNEN